MTFDDRRRELVEAARDYAEAVRANDDAPSTASAALLRHALATLHAAAMELRGEE